VALVLLIGAVGSRTTAHIDRSSWAALADPTATVAGDARHRAALLKRLCKRVAGVWEPCAAGEASPVLLVSPEDKSFVLLPVKQQRKGTSHLYSTLIEAETLARVPSQWVHHIYRAEKVGGMQLYRDVPAELLRAKQYPVAPEAGPHKALFVRLSRLRAGVPWQPQGSSPAPAPRTVATPLTACARVRRSLHSRSGSGGSACTMVGSVYRMGSCACAAKGLSACLTQPHDGRGSRGPGHCTLLNRGERLV
jgi:hypothetical protein